MGLGLTIRTFFREFLGSRVAVEIQTALDHERISILQLRQDYERRLQEKDQVLLDYKTELDLARNKISKYELVLIPLSSPAGGMLSDALNPREKPTFDIFSSAGSSSWTQEQAEFYKQQEVEAAAEKSAAKPTGEV